MGSAGLILAICAFNFESKSQIGRCVDEFQELFHFSSSWSGSEFQMMSISNRDRRKLFQRRRRLYFSVWCFHAKIVCVMDLQFCMSNALQTSEDFLELSNFWARRFLCPHAHMASLYVTWYIRPAPKRIDKHADDSMVVNILLDYARVH